MFGNFVKAIRLWKPFQMRGKLNACWKWHQPPVPQNGAIEAGACSPARICFCRAPSIQETSRLSPKYTGRAQRYHQEKYREREVQTHFRPCWLLGRSVLPCRIVSFQTPESSATLRRDAFFTSTRFNTVGHWEEGIPSAGFLGPGLRWCIRGGVLH